MAIATVVGTGVFAAAAILLAARTLAISRWQKSDREVTNLKEQLEQIVGHAHVVGDISDFGALVGDFPENTPRELPSERRKRLKLARERGALPQHLPSTFHDCQTFMFALQPDGRWSLSVYWTTVESTLAALNQVLLSYQLPAAETAEDNPLVPLWVSGQTYLVYTRLAPRSGRRSR